MSEKAANDTTGTDAAKTDTIEAGPSAGPSKSATNEAEALDKNDPASAKQLFARGSRNYLLKNYALAADDLSEACTQFEGVYGAEADELAMPFLLYGKVLIALAQSGENALMKEDVPAEEESGSEDDDDDDDDDVGGAAAADADGGQNGDAANASSAEKPTETEENGKPDADDANQEEEGNGNETADDIDYDSPVANLQVAWEVLEIAARIFERQGEPSVANLADTLFELAEISLENSHFEEAIRDYCT